MDVVESLVIALFCFVTVIMVLAILGLLIKFFSYIINLPDSFKIFLIKKKNAKASKTGGMPKDNEPLFYTIVDEQGNMRNLKLSIKDVTENKK